MFKKNNILRTCKFIQLVKIYNFFKKTKFSINYLKCQKDYF